MAHVRATGLGFIGSLRHPGDEFSLDDAVAKITPWVEIIKLDVPDPIPEDTAKQNKK